MIKIVIILPEWNNKVSDLTKEQWLIIHEWFNTKQFEIPFVPQVGMMIDLHDFFDCEKTLAGIDFFLGYVTINKIVIGKNDIALYCI